MTWPLQKACDAFYGNPRGDGDRASRKWEAENLVTVRPPFTIYYDGKPVRGVRIHRKCAASLLRVFNRIWEAAGHDQATVDRWGASCFAGSYVYRLKRGGGTLSMHAYGCALDLDPGRNAFHDTTPNFANVPQVVDAFEAEGWTWGGRWQGRACDGMHFQAAFVSEAARDAARGRTKPLETVRIVPQNRPEAAQEKLREEITADDLAAAGSRIVAGARMAKSAATIGAGAVGVGTTAVAVDPTDAVEQIRDTAESVKQTADAVAQAKDSASALADVLGWVESHWLVILIALCVAALLFALWRARAGAGLAERARVDDARNGLHIGRL